MNIKRSKAFIKVMLMTLGFLECCQITPFLTAQEASKTIPTGTPTGPANRAEVEAFFDGVLEAQKEAYHIAGAAISVVAKGSMLFSKGYGYADRDDKKPVRPGSTLFRIGSVSKLFTWTAVMQLVEEGKLDLDEDINSYLSDMRIPATYPQPITMAHLLTHTAGFEDIVIGLFAHSEGGLLPLGRVLSRRMPARVRPPGQLASYSNYSTALAGYVVQQISNMPWEEYIEQKILEPLEMNHTTVRQPIPADLSNDMSIGYSYSGGEYIEKGFEFVPAIPAGSISASAEDMARFMMAHLQNGRYGQTRILSDETAQKMQTRLFTHSPQLNGMLYGFYEMNTHGQRILGHGGDTLWFHSDLVLFPDQQVGLFVSFNSDTGAKARSDLVKAFINHYYPPPESPNFIPLPDSREVNSQFAGSYRMTRVSHTTMAKLMMLMTLNVTATHDGYLKTTGPGQDEKKWAAVVPLVFKEVDGGDTMVFRVDEGGNATHLFLGSLPFLAFLKLGVYETPSFQIGLLALSLLIMLSAVVVWPISAWRNRGGRWEGGPPPLGRIVGWFGSAISILTAIGIVFGLREPNEIAFGIPPLLNLVLLLPFVAGIFIIVTVIFALVSWAKGYWRISRRIHYTLVAMAGIIFIWWFYHWNLIGVSLS